MKITFLRLAVILVVAFASMAPAPKGSIQVAGQVMKKLDPIDPPSYTDDFFRDRDLLHRDVSAVVRIMADPANGDPMTWCTGISDILNLATLTNTYFDIGQPNNPAFDDFKKDWLKVRRLAGCP
ncbi:MAG: hypothetical protein ACREOW_03135 [Thermodesulfobacteriota bacterium]